ncbi:MULTISPECIES: glycoside hydrolase family 73 protein [Janthinobacterium]|jgi:flagellar protein FlgJ|uniref:Glucosaminidase domain-containing protein n=1 Tax=Janthinobacterium lividum TaxID=29581 RepID=A0AAJ4MXM6_9BURK|nr:MULTISPECIES: glucosaminidase domain-containing protein [Janthinobacterium]KAB0324646.1 flagellar assembly peptidoglycan hydrolase FlgJ [Janthinobacterium lividum]MCC7712804.1 glucosaminidase domain-containing protein [Janthinobacterium lividum]OEZ65749.1 peptidoglycan hydrolase FlgJ [Janthinobacterium lividum]PHV22244.1 flagellar assembly peptidoglycan hydrolase FlgJ [Janthinobacterium sp. BJB446]QSX98752.1 glucosaminidase domain-containing protein [Janthinobacterium lividum]
MRQADFLTTRATAATPSTAATSAVQSNMRATDATSSSGNFSSVFRQVQGEVARFIEQGGGNATSLNPQGRAYLEQSQPVNVLGSINQGGEIGEVQQQFLASIKPWTQETGARLGVAPEIVAAHAALESGWGQRPLRQGTGADTNNLFGIKAGGKWQGDVASNVTTEYEAGSGTALKKTERFRSYPDQASAFRDYAQVLLDNPRYRAALNTGADAGAFAQGLARGGYATDPNYAAKLTQLATRLQRTAAAD